MAIHIPTEVKQKIEALEQAVLSIDSLIVIFQSQNHLPVEAESLQYLMTKESRNLIECLDEVRSAIGLPV